MFALSRFFVQSTDHFAHKLPHIGYELEHPPQLIFIAGFLQRHFVPRYHVKTGVFGHYQRIRDYFRLLGTHVAPSNRELQRREIWTKEIER